MELEESVARSHLPYRAEYCATDRARCKRCDDFMYQDTLKMANLTKSRFHEGYDASYYHVDCFFRVKRPSSLADIRHFETLRYEDQKMLEKAVETKGASILATSSCQNGNDSMEEEADVNYEDFLVEYAKSNRSKCNLCDQFISKATVRLGKLDYDTEMYGGIPIPRWFHVECFKESLDQLEFYGNIEELDGFEQLEKEDQKMLKKTIKPHKDPSTVNTTNKKIKIEKTCDVLSEDCYSDNSEEDRLLKEQSDRFYRLREHVKGMKRKDIQYMLDCMGQKSDYKATPILLDMATDVLLFGPLEDCPECNQAGTMQLRGGSYICTHSTDSYCCNYETRDPIRRIPIVPDQIICQYNFFRTNYTFFRGKRIFPSKFLKAIEQKNAENNNLVQDGAPLDGLTIGVASWRALKNDKIKVQNKIISLGGKVTTNLDRCVFVVLSNRHDYNRQDSQKILVARELELPFATDDFLFKIESKRDVVPRLKESLLGDWPGDLEERFSTMNVNKLVHNIKSRSIKRLEAATTSQQAESSSDAGSEAEEKATVVKQEKESPAPRATSRRKVRVKVELLERPARSNIVLRSSARIRVKLEPVEG